MKYQLEILSAEEFTDFATLNNLGGCSDYGEEVGLDGYQVDFVVEVTKGDESRQFNITFQSEERTNGMRNYSGWEMATSSAVDDDYTALEKFLDYDTEEVMAAMEKQAKAMAKQYIETLVEQEANKFEGLEGEAVRFTVEISNGERGDITYPDYAGQAIRGYQRNIQTVDEFGNNVGINGTVTKVLKVEVFDGEWKEINLS